MLKLLQGNETTILFSFYKNRDKYFEVQESNQGYGYVSRDFTPSTTDKCLIILNHAPDKFKPTTFYHSKRINLDKSTDTSYVILYFK